MTHLGSGLAAGNHHEDALSVREAELATARRIGAPEGHILTVQTNLGATYFSMGRFEDALRTSQDVYSGRVKLNGDQHERTLRAANNYAHTLLKADRFEEAKILLQKVISMARGVLGGNHRLTLRMRSNYALSLYADPAATLEDLREAVTTIEDTARIARRVMGGAHPLTTQIEISLRRARAGLAATEQS